VNAVNGGIRRLARNHGFVLSDRIESRQGGRARRSDRAQAASFGARDEHEDDAPPAESLFEDELHAELPCR
jgi:hypothetical protein